MKLQLTSMIIATLFFCSCNNSGLADKASGDINTEDSDLIKANKSKALACCFLDENEGQQFFPAGSATIKPVNAAASGELNCSENGDSPSSFSKIYQSGSGKMTLRINDFCSNPRRSQSDYDLKKKNTMILYGKNQADQNLDDPGGLYTAFVVYSPSQKMAYLQAIVDKRFAVIISGIDQQSADDVIALFKMVPVNQLAAFKK
jgi:hypothetical protein